MVKRAVKMTQCDDCCEKLPVKMTVRTGGKTLCRVCMLKDEEPIQVILVRSSWAPWGDEPVVPVGDLLYPELSGRMSRSRQVKDAEVAVKRVDE